MLIQQEKHDSEIRRQIADEEEKREKNTKLKNNEALIDELVFFISPMSCCIYFTTYL